MVITVRHFESEKNTEDIHGYCHLDTITPNGFIQAENLAFDLKAYDSITSICYFPTLQAEKSAALLSQLTGIKLEEKPLSLSPFNMGVANGISNKELEKKFPRAYKSLEQFRHRIIDASKLEIPNAENPDELETRLIAWWKGEGKKILNNKIIVGSNSTLIMLTNLFRNCLPSSKRYMCFEIPNGSMRVWEYTHNQQDEILETSYPDISQKRVVTHDGFIQTSCYYSNWSVKDKICIVCPGYFGNNRLGPYSLFVKLAQVLSSHGVTTILMDYLGSGESSFIKRTFHSDIYSIQKTIEFYSNSKPILLVGHSLSCALVAKLCADNPNIQGIALAPLVTLKDLADNFLEQAQMEELIENGLIVRRGVEFYKSYIDDAEVEWKTKSKYLGAVIVAKNDQYSSYKDTAKNHYLVDGADHNFSENESYDDMLKIVTDIAITNDKLETQHFSLDKLKKHEA